MLMLYNEAVNPPLPPPTKQVKLRQTRQEGAQSSILPQVFFIVVLIGLIL